ncbi:MAG: error-prone DNA polymerase [Promicromonosporaceae bacterium]|nr:error-prone DNA polymerase [Promicromonosporaceae bacterium]
MYEPRYAELHAHSAFSFLDGASHPEEMVAEATRLGLSALAITDHDGFYGVVRHAQAAHAVGLPTIFGSELRLPVALTGAAPVLDAPTGTPDARAEHLLVLARGPVGYASMSRAISEGHLKAGVKGKASYDLDSLAGSAAGDWLVLTGCRKGSVRRALTTHGSEASRRELDKLISLFGRENVAVELTVGADARTASLHQALAEIAEWGKVPVVATTGAHFARRPELVTGGSPGGLDLVTDGQLANALAAVRANTSMAELAGYLPPPIGYLRSAAEMTQLFARHPDAVPNAARLGDECAFDLSLVAPDLPPYPVPPGHTEATWLRHLVEVGGAERYGSRDACRVPGAWEMLDHELAIIEQLHFPGYFLIVYDLVEFCRQSGIMCQGRGSAANSAVCYALGITAVDAVKHGLLFERFLAPERDGPPDIDLDIESLRREEVIQHVYEKFGRSHAAQVANVISYRPRSAIRDSARALGYDIGQQDAWSKSIERWGNIRANPKQEPSADTRIAERDRTAEAVWGGGGRSAGGGAGNAGLLLSEASGQVEPVYRVHVAKSDDDGGEQDLDAIPENVVDLAERFLRLPRHLGIHPGGMVLCSRPVIEVCPVEWARMEGRTVLQWDKEDCADAGLVKFDLLGLGMLTAIRYAFEFIRARTGGELELHHLPDDDPAVYDLLCAADTVGLFQVESRAQMATLPRLKPRNFYDIVVEVALIRPGPIQGGSVHPYINRRNGREPVSYLHPLLEKSLERTLGIPLFQEQLMQMAIDVAGFTPAESDQLRRAMGSKRSLERMEALRERLMSGMIANDVPAEAREQIFDKLKAFADFGFPESHAYSFAFLVYASAWLKVHYPAEFYAGLLGAQPMGFYSPQSLVADARRHGLTVLRPSLNDSVVLASVERLPDDFELPPEHMRLPRAGDPQFGPDADLRYAVREGLAQVRGIGNQKAEEMVAARPVEGFADLVDLVRRVELSTKQLENLATAGAFECLGLDRRDGLWAAGALAQETPDTLRGVSVGIAAPELPGMSEVELVLADAFATGITPDSFPTQLIRPSLEANGVVTVADALEVPVGRRIAVGGAVTHRQRPGTAAGVTFLSIEDETGLLNVVCSPAVWEQHRKVARRAKAMVVRGRVERADGATNLVAEHLAPLNLPVEMGSRDFQ